MILFCVIESYTNVQPISPFYKEISNITVRKRALRGTTSRYLRFLFFFQNLLLPFPNIPRLEWTTRILQVSDKSRSARAKITIIDSSVIATV